MKTQLTYLMSFVCLFAIFFASSSCEDRKLPPGQVISYERADSLENNYIESRYTIISGVIGYPDTREFWFSLDSLKKYIEYVEYEAGQQNLSNLGMRVYLGAYPPSANGIDSLGYATVFFVPTSLQAPSPIRQGFVPIQSENENIDGIDALNMGHGGIPPNDL